MGRGLEFKGFKKKCTQHLRVFMQLVRILRC